jgi:hypothetical protein
VECALGSVLEMRIPLAEAGISDARGARVQCSLWQGGLPVDAVPQQGWIEVPTDPARLAAF